MDDDLTIRASTAKRLAAALTVLTLLVNAGGWLSAQAVGLSQMRTEISSLKQSGSEALKAHTSDAMDKFINQERRIVRLETKLDEIDTRLTGIQTDLKDVLREVRK